MSSSLGFQTLHYILSPVVKFILFLNLLSWFLLFHTTSYCWSSSGVIYQCPFSIYNILVILPMANISFQVFAEWMKIILYSLFFRHSWRRKCSYCTLDPEQGSTDSPLLPPLTEFPGDRLQLQRWHTGPLKETPYDCSHWSPDAIVILAESPSTA